MTPDFLRTTVSGTFFSIDIEGDGLPNQRPVEISICEFVDGAFVKEHYLLANPGRSMSRYAVATHGLRDNDLLGMGPMSEHVDAIREIIRGQYVVGHSVLDDVNMLFQDMPDFLLCPLAIIDTQRMLNFFNKRDEVFTSLSLEKAAAEANILASSAPADLARGSVHSASTDAWMTGRLFTSLAMKITPNDTLKNNLQEMFTLKISEARKRKIATRMDDIVIAGMKL